MRDWRERNPLRAAFAHLRQGAAARRKAFELTFEQFAEFARRTGYVALKGPHGWECHVDRIDPERGYTADNIQLLTASENVAKENRERRAAFAAARFSPPPPRHLPNARFERP